MGCEFGEGEASGVGQRMSHWRDDDAVLVEERSRVDVGVIDGQIHDRCIESLAHQLRQEGGCGGFDDDQLDTRE